MTRFKIIIVILGIALSGVLFSTNYAQAAAAPVQIKSNNGANSLCMNRNGAGTTQGTFIIGYNCGYSNNDFEYDQMNGACGAGVVTQACPFSNHQLDAYWAGKPIIRIDEYDNDWCAGTSASNTFTLRLEPCPNIDGVGGGWNSVWVATNINGVGCLIAVRATNNSGKYEDWNAVTTGYTGGIAIETGNAPNCGSATGSWSEVFS